MKQLTLFAGLVVLTAAVAAAGQSRPTAISPGNEKTNKRPAAEATKTPPATQVETADDAGDVITVDTRLVTIPVKVIDRKNRFVSGLTKGDFRVSENGIPQEITHFSNEQEPFTVALVLDMSYSTTFKLEEIQMAAIAFVDKLRRNDKVLVVSFDKDVAVRCEPTSDRKTIYKAIMSTKIGTGTSLYEAVDLVLNSSLRRVEGRKAVILFTDGVDTSSENANDRENLSDAMESDALVFPIRYDTFRDVQAMKDRPVIEHPNSPTKTTPPIVPSTKGSPLPFPIEMIGMPSSKGTSAEEYASAEEYLKQLAIRTGGDIYIASSVDNLTIAFSQIASELREFYSLGYYPREDGTPGQSIRVKVQVNRKEVAVRSKNSYVVGGERTKR